MSLVVACLAARLNVELVNAPVVQLFSKGHDTYVIVDVQTACPVEIQHDSEGARVSLEVELQQ